VKMFAKHMALVIALTGVLGCGSEDALDPAAWALRQRLLSPTEPPGAMSLAEARDAVSADAEVVVVGQIDSEPAWQAGKAVFVIRELAEDDDAHGGSGHDPANCPFCKRRRAQAPTAVVQFLDEEGNVLSYDPRTLLGLEANQVVVVRGRAEIDELDTLLVSAESIYVKQ
jgi:hypothetical protein